MNVCLSIIIPVYNSELYISQCVKSIMNQAVDNMEVILINDGSTDNSHKICSELALSDNRIRYFCQENKGVSRTRNYGIELAHGEYIMFVDSDDLLPDGSISRFVEEHKKSYDLVMGGYALFCEDISVAERKSCTEFEGDIRQFLLGIDSYIQPPCLLSPCSKLFKRELLLKDNSIRFPTELSYGEDAVFVLKYLQHTQSVRCIDVVNYLYRKENSNSLSSKFRKDKLEINMSIAHLIKELLYKHNCENKDFSYYACCVKFFDDFTTELISSSLSYTDKKSIYHKYAVDYDIYNCYNEMPSLNFKQKLRKMAIKSGFIYRTMFILYTLHK